MKRRINSQTILGLLFVLIGIAILLNERNIFSWYFIRSYGFFIIGFIGLLKAVSLPFKRGIYFNTVILLVGLYFILGEWELYLINRGLNISVITLILGISFYPAFLTQRNRWEFLLFGNIIILIGLMFLLAYLNVLPSYILVSAVDTYWPVLLIVVGLGFLLKAIKNPENRSKPISPQN